MNTKLIVYFFFVFIILFNLGCQDKFNLPTTIESTININLYSLKKIDNRIYLFQFVDFNFDSLNDMIVIFKINEEEGNFLYALYKNTNSKFILIDKFLDNHVPLDGLLCWNKGESFNHSNSYLIDIYNFKFSMEYKFDDYSSNSFLKDHFFLIFSYPDYIDYVIMKIKNEKISILSRIGELRYILENSESLYFISNFSSDNNSDSKIYLRTYIGYLYNKNNFLIKKILNIPKAISLTIYDYFFALFNENKKIDSLFELFFFAFYNQRNKINKEWLADILKKVQLKDKKFEDLSNFMFKRFELNDFDFYNFFFEYRGAYPKMYN